MLARFRRACWSVSWAYPQSEAFFPARRPSNTLPPTGGRSKLKTIRDLSRQSDRALVRQAFSYSGKYFLDDHEVFDAGDYLDSAAAFTAGLDVDIEYASSSKA